MSDLYSELLVKKKQTAKDLVVKYGLIALTVIMVLGGLVLNVLLLVPAIALGIACYFVIPKTDLEYEYLFVNGELDIDMIMSKSKNMFFVIQETLSLPMMVTSAPDRSASFLCTAVPIATANVMP